MNNYLVDPYDITNRHRSKAELEAFLVFAICVAGKTARIISKKVEAFFAGYGTQDTPFDILRAMIATGTLDTHLKRVGMGKYDLLSRSFQQLVSAGFDLRTATAEQLEGIPGIGMKTSRFFILHSREGARVAVIDTHILKYLRAASVPNVPDIVPSGKEYLRLEKAVLRLADSLHVSAEQFDLRVWTWYSEKGQGLPSAKFIQFKPKNKT